MRVLAWPIALVGLLLLPALGFAQGRQVAEPYGVVSLGVTYQQYDPVIPWNKSVEQTIRANAVVLAGRTLLTTADVVKDANLIEVRKFGRYPDYPARVVLVDYEVNLALLDVDDPGFWEGLLPLPLAERPIAGGRFTINRWRPNGRFEQGSGEVVDVRMATSPFGTVEIPMIRGSTGMSGLGWAEVLTVDGRVTGLVTSGSDQGVQATNSDVLRLFVEAAHRSPYPGFAQRGFSWQQLNQSALRRYFGLEDSATGVLIRTVYPGGTGSGQLKQGDILHRIGGYDVDPEGYVDHPVYGALPFVLAINETLAPTIPAVIERDGRRMTVQLKRTRFDPDDYRVLPPRFDKQADFEVFGGMVLQELSLNYLRAWGQDWRTKAPSRLVMAYELNSLRERGEPPSRIVFISKVLPDPSNLGYDDVAGAIITSADGKPVRSLAEFREAVAHPPDGFHVLETMPGMGRRHLVYRASELSAVNARVRERYGIPER